MFEARQIVAAAQKYNRIVQHGTNCRSGVAREAIEKIREGLIGDVYMSRGLCYKWRDTIGRKPEEPVPSGVHYDLWLGPAPQHAFTRNRFLYNWHWFWEYGNGDIGNQGIHQVDVARWGLGVKYPTRVSAMGGHFLFDDDQETPNTLTATFEFEEGEKKKLLVFEVRHWISNHESGIGEDGRAPNTVGAVIYGSKGYVVIWDEDHGKYHSYLGREQAPGPTGVNRGNNWANFIDALRSRKPAELNAPIEEGAISTTLVHLANISYRLRRSVRFDAASYSCPGDAEANAMFRRQYRPGFEVPELV
jgi:predicted dehydrogenase